MHEFLAASASSPWIFPLIFALCVIDGFFPPVPSEFLVVAAASLSMTLGHPNIAVIVAVAAAGAGTGDLVAYAIGRRIGLARIRRRPRAAAALDRATDGLQHRTASTLMTARFIPVGRIVVNFGAGALGLPLRRFLPVVAVSAVTWSIYTSVIGVSIGPWLADKPLLGIAVAIGIALTVGAVIDAVSAKIHRRKATAVKSAASPASEETSPAFAGGVAALARDRPGPRRVVLPPQKGSHAVRKADHLAVGALHSSVGLDRGEQ